MERVERTGLPRVEFKVLGPLEAVADGRVLPLGGPKQRTLLAVLLVNANTAVTADRLCDAIWGEAPPASAQANVRSYAAALRRVLDPDSGGERLSQGHGGYQLRALPDEVDLLRFERLVARGRAALAAGDHRVAVCHLREALELWRGDAFDGLVQHDALHIEAARLEEARLTAFEDYADARLALGEHHDMVGLLQAQVARHPLRESLWAKLMIAQYRSQRPGDALESYTLARAALRDELGLEPGAGLRRLHRAVLTRDTLLGAEPAPVQPVRPAPAWQPVHRLPSDTVDFVGRHMVMPRVAALLEPAAATAPNGAGAQAAPVVVLAGPPGVGKTALATRLAHLMRHTFPDGRLFLRLDGARGPERAPRELLAELLLSIGVSVSSLPEATVDRAATLRSLLTGRKVLVVLDDARDEAQIRPLLPGIPGCAVLVTTRDRAAGPAGAHLVDVAPLDDKEARDLLGRIVGPQRLALEPGAAERVLDGCAGLPLALRVTGARLASRPDLRVRCLADRLAGEQGTRERQSGTQDTTDAMTDATPDATTDAVRACVAAGYRELAPEAAKAFRAIGLLPSLEFPGWELAALLDARDTDRPTDALLDANLVQVVRTDDQGRPRYRVHDVVHAHAAERARDEEPPSWRRAAVARALDGWLARLRTARDQLVRGGTPDATCGGMGDPDGWLEGERAGLVTAVEFAASSGYGDRAAELAAAMEEVCHLRNWWDEWERAARAVLHRSRADGDQVTAALAQGSLARASAVRGRVDDAVTRFGAAVERLDELGESRHAAWLRIHRSFAVADRGMARLAHADAESAAEVLGGLGDAHGRVLALRSLGFALVCQGREADAVAVLEPALEAAERLGRPLALADVLQLLAWSEIGLGRFGRAARHLHRALAEYRLLRHRPGEAYALLALGRIHVELGPDQAPRAVGPLDEAAAIFTDIGEHRGEALTAYWLGKTRTALGDPARGTAHHQEAIAAFRRLGMPFWLAYAQREHAQREGAGAAAAHDPA
ncbi:BTAD domain-containing putative transcriptional regulator [Streptomyces sp. NPDC002537]